MADSENFIDYVKIFLRSGKGGSGSMHFLRDKLTAKGGPDGGDGGRGGHIILRGNAQMWTLLHLKYRKHIHAEDGEDGDSLLKTGATGKNIYLDVPLGTIARDAETGIQICEITNDGDEFIIAEGGRGGQGNWHFRTAVNQAPTYVSPRGEGVEGWTILELKVLADVGLVGFPNAGKSTLLSAVSAARPKIADYPFTTLVPNLGIVGYRDNRSFVMADIPGIIENAHLGKGLGQRFLRHIERNSVLLFMIPCDTNSITKEYEILLNELKMYNPHLLHKPRLLAVTKCDIIDDELEEMIKKDMPKDVPYVFISAVAQLGIDKLKDTLWKMLN